MRVSTVTGRCFGRKVLWASADARTRRRVDRRCDSTPAKNERGLAPLSLLKTHKKSSCVCCIFIYSYYTKLLLRLRL